MTSWISWPERALDSLRTRLDGWGLWLLRLWLAQEFGRAGWTKLAGGWQAPEWFAGLAFPPPLAWLPPDLNWGLAAVTEGLAAAALLLGWPVRLAASALLFVTGVAVYAVHFDLGWAGWDQIDTPDGQGFKVPLMIALMLLVLLERGPGRWAWKGPR
jgi:putative oxidoreductase